MTELTTMLQRFHHRYQRALLTRAAVLLTLGSILLGLLAWRLAMWRVPVMWRRGTLIGSAALAILALGWWLRRRWISPRAAPAHLDQALGLQQRLVTAAEFADTAQASSLYPLLVEDAARHCAPDRARFPRPWDRTAASLAAVILLFLLLPRVGGIPKPLARMPSSAQPPRPPEPKTPPPPAPQPPPPQSSQAQAQQPPQGAQSASSQPQHGGASDQSQSRGGNASPQERGQSQPQNQGGQGQSEHAKGQGEPQAGSGSPKAEGSQSGGAQQAKGDQRAGARSSSQAQANAGSAGESTSQGQGAQQQQQGSQQANAGAHQTPASQQGRQQGGGQQQGGQQSGQQQADAQQGQGKGGSGLSPGDQEALKAEIQGLLKQVSGELKDLQAQLENAQNLPKPEAGTSTDPNLYGGDAEPLAPKGTSALPVQLQTDDVHVKTQRPGGGTGRPSSTASAATPKTAAETASLSEAPLEETATTRQSVPPEYRGVFDRVNRSSGQPSEQKP